AHRRRTHPPPTLGHTRGHRQSRRRHRPGPAALQHRRSDQRRRRISSEKTLTRRGALPPWAQAELELRAPTMPLKIDPRVTPQKLLPKIQRLFELSAHKILSLEKTWKPGQGAPVFTVQGRYTSRGWTEWTQGFQFGSALLQFDATGDERFLEMGRRGTVERMAAQISHVGVHDHGFNNISTYGNLLRLMGEGRILHNQREQELYELALKVSGAVQAARWTCIANGQGFIYSFNGPHSLFID